MKTILTFIFMFIFATNVLATQPLVRNFTHANYKSGTQNWGIAQDKSNEMYFANNNGLLVFNGINWKTYPIKNGTNVRSIVYGNDNKYYASSFNEFGYFEKKRNWR